MSLANKVAIVTGAGSGIGAAIAVKLAEQDARLAIVDRNEIGLKNVSDITEKLGTKPLTIIADVTKDADCKKIISETLNFFGRIDILINNAGITRTSTILEENVITIYDEVIATNLRAPVVMTHLAAKHIVETKGNIVNISSGASLGVLERSVAYCTSKAGLDHFSRCVALELASYGVRVNTVNPGPVKTDIFENAGMSKQIQEIIWKSLGDMTALKRISDSKEIADLVAFLVSDKARGITGAAFVTDNGTLLKPPTS